MDLINLGNSGIKVSRICLGCMSFGDSSTHFHDWALNFEESEKIILKAFDCGINFFDTANVK